MSGYQEERFPIPTPWRLVRELRLRRPPWWMVALLLIVVVATWVPLALIYDARSKRSGKPRVHFFLDMDKQAKFKPQSAHPWFLDGRAMRQPVEGTIARGYWKDDPAFYNGYTMIPATNSSTTNYAATEKSALGIIQFVKTLPDQIGVDERILNRGPQRYQIHCAPCHGSSGTGDGMVNQRAIELKESKWVPATNLLTQDIRDRANGQLFQAISDGVRNMPSYKLQISPNDRWAIVAYLRQLQSESPVAVASATSGSP